MKRKVYVFLEKRFKYQVIVAIRVWGKNIYKFYKQQFCPTVNSFNFITTWHMIIEEE